LINLLDHLGLAAMIDKALGTRLRRQVSYGKIFTAMLLNGPGFTGRTLHIYSEFFDDKPVSRLIGEGIEASHINDDAVGLAFIRSMMRRLRSALENCR
jgi:hypothetical protein